MKRQLSLLTALSLLMASGCATTQESSGASGESTERSAMEAKQLVERSRLTLEGFAADQQIGADFRALMKRAKGLVVAPQVLRGAFIFGVSGGSGVFLSRDEKGERWNGPAFYTIGEVSFGLQAGGEASEVVLLAMTDRGVAALLSDSVKLGGQVGVAAGPVGLGAAAATANLSADILSYSRSKGLYGGVSVDGAVVAKRDSLNRAYYGKDATPADILVRRAVTNPESTPLVEAVAKLGGGS